MNLTPLKELGFQFGQVPKDHPTQPIIVAKKVGDLIYVSGHVPMKDGQVIAGKLGAPVTVKEAARAAGLCAAQCLMSAAAVVENDRSIVSVVSVMVYVNCAPGFNNTSAVANGASDLLNQVFPDRHTRAAVGVCELPHDAVVEITMVLHCS